MIWARKAKGERAHLFLKLEAGERSLCKAVTTKGDDLEGIDLTAPPCLTCAMLNAKRKP